MIVNKFKLPNNNTLIWLGNQPIYECENILILAGREVLFLKTIKEFNIADIQKDMEQLGHDKFFKKYGWPHNSSGHDLYWELKDTEEYPPQ